ncbi:NAD(P)-dependent oxidoreductase [Kineococcus rhizosphaerae]|uniref:3-hydroxyisobutyrate dehydrogenase-like beta-hydroxyacid dehydrogenase n=1 Tax=Kineococcus rhizosphaerae TaxID=559628 RepID=A0A2T0QUS5_9ACTN|nr:NAD(P)-binding domain-containing protein [Kineococcus rhizosphaerae]PRY08833.1 3-hydroxyisobutyrate dehydrogenase-like beta-hydroxyacid dehydrogenase [Kineococcus rhizosphaerae]
MKNPSPIPLPRVVILGAGLMGSAIARELLRLGCSVDVWNRTPAKTTPLVQEGAGTGTLQSVMTGPALVLLCLSNYETARAVLAEAEEPLRDAALVNLVTGSPTEAEEFSSWASERGARYLDGAIEAYPNDIGQSTTLVNYSGHVDVWTDHRELLLAIAGASTYVGERPGAANVLDAAMAGSFYNVSIGAFLEAQSYALSQGVTPQQLRSGLPYWLELLRRSLEEGISAVEGGVYDTDQATLVVYHDAVRSWLSTVNHADQRSTLLTANEESLRSAVAAGHGPRSIFAQHLLTSKSVFS